MPRGPRISYPGCFHHVYARGNNKQPIYLTDKDRVVFLERVGSNVSLWGIRCIAWALMPNHFHFLLRNESGEMPTFMKCLLTAYSMYFNSHHQRVGHLFQNRYQSPVISKDSYLREVIRYIHLNPVRSGLVGSLYGLEQYPWTGHRQLLHGGIAVWQDIAFIRELFSGPRPEEWRSRYREFVEIGYRETMDAPEIPPGVPLSSFRPATRSKRQDPPVPPGGFQQVLSRISVRSGIPAGRIVGKDRAYAAVQARREVLVACRAELGASIAEISRWLEISEGAGEYLARSAIRHERTS